MEIAAATRTATPAAVEPAKAVYARHRDDLMSLPGAESVSWSKSRPGEVRLRLANDGFRRLADNVLRDTVDGVRLVLTVNPDAPAPVPGGDPWADSPINMARAVSSMPGITAASFHAEHGIRTLTFSTFEAGVADRLKAIVNPAFGSYDVHFWTRTLPKRPA